MSTFNKYRLKGAYHYDWYKTEPWYKECVDTIVDFCKGSTVDAGCGDGLVVSKILEQGYNASGIDNDPDAIRLCQQNPKTSMSVLQDDLNDPKIKWGGWQYMCSLNTIEHLDKPEGLKKIIEQMEKGAIVITNQYLGGSLGEDHRREYDYQELIDFFEEFNPKGFKLAGGEYIGVKILK